MTRIVQKEDPVLRATALPVTTKELTTPAFKKIIKDMQTALHREDDGVAIAAPQIGVSKQIFIVAGKVFDPAFDGGPHATASLYPDVIYINPTIIKTSKRQKWLEEGCLSVRWLYGKTKRYQNVTISYLDEHGTLQTRGAGGLMAQIFQHEIDHLHGILFIDHAKDVEDLPPPPSHAH